MKRIDNNEEANNVLANIHLGLDNKIRAIYNLGYLQGYKDATEETLQNIKDEILEKKFNDLNGEPLTEEDLEEKIDDQA